MFTNSLAGQRYFQRASKQTTNLASINMTQLRKLEAGLMRSQADSEKFMEAVVGKMLEGE